VIATALFAPVPNQAAQQITKAARARSRPGQRSGRLVLCPVLKGWIGWRHGLAGAVLTMFQDNFLCGFPFLQWNPERDGYGKQSGFKSSF